MPARPLVHPAPPADVTELVAAYRQTVTSFADVADGLTDQEWARPTSCAGWTAHDHLAHVVHVEDYLVTGRHPGGPPGATTEPVEPGRPDHVHSPFTAWMEEGVRARDGVAPDELVSQLRELVEIRSAGMYDAELTLDTPVHGTLGRDTTFGRLTRLRIQDVWVHEQDLREVVDRPGSLDSPGASQFLDSIMRMLPRRVLEQVAPDPGTVVILESTGPVTARAGVRIGLDAAGEVVAHDLFTGRTAADDEDPSVDDESADRTTTISMSTHSLTRRAAGRVSTEDTAFHVVGDEDLARRVLDALVVTP